MLGNPVVAGPKFKSPLGSNFEPWAKQAQPSAVFVTVTP